MPSRAQSRERSGHAGRPVSRDSVHQQTRPRKRGRENSYEPSWRSSGWTSVGTSWTRTGRGCGPSVSSPRAAPGPAHRPRHPGRGRTGSHPVPTHGFEAPRRLLDLGGRDGLRRRHRLQRRAGGGESAGAHAQQDAGGSRTVAPDRTSRHQYPRCAASGSASIPGGSEPLGGGAGAGAARSANVGSATGGAVPALVRASAQP